MQQLEDFFLGGLDRERARVAFQDMEQRPARRGRIGCLSIRVAGSIVVNRPSRCYVVAGDRRALIRAQN
jgi:hypothetical protein